MEGPRNEVGPLVIGHDPTAAKFETGKVDMEDICEWPTDMGISFSRKATVGGRDRWLVFPWMPREDGSPRKAALHCAIVRTRDWTHPSKLLLA